jgi:hypothetical protein
MAPVDPASSDLFKKTERCQNNRKCLESQTVYFFTIAATDLSAVIKKAQKNQSVCCPYGNDNFMKSGDYQTSEAKPSQAKANETVPLRST